MFWIKLKNYRLLFTLLLTILVDILFWNQGWGLNTVLISVLLTVFIALFNPLSLLRKNVWITITCTLASAFLVLLYNSTAAGFAFIVSFTVMIGFFHQSDLRTVYSAFLTSALSLLHTPLIFTDFVNQKEKSSGGKFFSRLKLLLFPFIALFIFYWIYKFANPYFDELSSSLWNKLWERCSSLLSGLSLGRICFLLGTFLLVLAALFNRNIRNFVNPDLRHSDFYTRNKPARKSKMKRPAFGQLFKNFWNEYRIACIMFIMLNALLLTVNMVDINRVWLNFNYSDVANLAQFVHEGTYLLILSILISMGIVLYFFNGNINLLQNKKTLLALSFIWIFQNAILVISVAIRNYHYIHQHGIAYKRIGVIVFLVLVLIGLITLTVKISAARSSFFLFRTNAWAVYFVMIAMACFDWDMIIIQNNVRHPNEAGIDKYFLTGLSDKTLFVLHENRDWFADMTIPVGSKTYPEQIDQRVEDFLKEYPTRSWAEFNFAEAYCYEKLHRLGNK